MRDKFGRILTSSAEKICALSLQCLLPQKAGLVSGRKPPAMLQICAYPSGAVYAVSEVRSCDPSSPRSFLRTRMIATPTLRYGKI